MNPFRRRRNVLACFFCIALIGLHINSTAWFRGKLAVYHENRGEVVRAIRLYNKILRRETVKKRLKDEVFAKTCFDLANLYGKLGLTNSAIESYARGSHRFPQIDPDRYYTKTDYARDKLLTIGLLEGGRHEQAIDEFQKLS